VESLHQKRQNEINRGTPFGCDFSIETDDWDSLYKVICNMTEAQHYRHCTISAVHKISIALQMHGDAEWNYKFRPQHIIHDELCMVLQKHAFRLTSTGEAIEIPLSTFDSRSSAHVMVHEIAFGKKPIVEKWYCWIHSTFQLPIASALAVALANIVLA
jgi:hypothetical protein